MSLYKLILELGGNVMTDSENPFVLLARITVKEGMIDSYLEIAEKVDKSVEKTEEGMLFHSFDRDPDHQHKFVWTEVYRKSDNFLFHADSPLFKRRRKACGTSNALLH